MSAYVVEQETINRVLGALYWNRATAHVTPPGFDRPIDALSEGQLRDLGRALMAMNVSAVRQRYEGADARDMIPQGFEFFSYSPSPVTPCQGLKSVQCFSYQCAEGDVPEAPLYKWLDACENKLAFAIVDGLPEYDKAEWA